MSDDDLETLLKSVIESIEKFHTIATSAEVQLVAEELGKLRALIGSGSESAEKLSQLRRSLTELAESISLGSDPVYGRTLSGRLNEVRSSISHIEETVTNLLQTLEKIRKEQEDQKSVAAKHPLGVTLVGIVVLAIVLAAQCLPFHDVHTWRALSSAMNGNAVIIVSVAAGLGLLSGLMSGLAEKRWAGESWSKGLSDGLVRAGAAVLGAITAIGAAKAVEYFTIGGGPQVVFIGSGTVHRYLFSNHEEALHIPLGEGLGPNDIKFWAFEGQSGYGINFAAYAYDHRSDIVNEDKVPLIGMASADVVTRDDKGLAIWKTSEDGGGEGYFKCRMNPSNREYDDFAVVPVQVDLTPNWYVRPTSAVEELDDLPPILVESGGGRSILLPKAHGTGNVRTFIPGGSEICSDAGTSTAISVSQLPSSVSTTNGRYFVAHDRKDGAAGMELFKWEIIKPENFSLNVSHISAEEGTIDVAIGNYAIPPAERDRWSILTCGDCGARDLVLTVPVREDKNTDDIEVWRPLPYACLALQYLDNKVRLAEKLNKYIHFDDCPTTLSDPGACRCKLTDHGVRLLLRDTSISPPECGQQGRVCRCRRAPLNAGFVLGWLTYVERWTLTNLAPISSRISSRLRSGVGCESP